MKTTAYLDKAFRELTEAVEAFREQPCELNYYRMDFETQVFKDAVQHFTKPHKPCNSFANSKTSVR